MNSTTVLDVRSPQILQMMKELKDKLITVNDMITHDLVVAQTCDRVAIFTVGEIVEIVL